MRTSFGIILAAAVSLGLLNQTPQTPLYTVLVPNHSDIIFSEEESSGYDAEAYNISKETAGASASEYEIPNYIENVNKTYFDDNINAYSEENTYNSSDNNAVRQNQDQSAAVIISSTFQTDKDKNSSAALNAGVFNFSYNSKMIFQPRVQRSEADIILDNALLSIISSSSDIAAKASIGSKATNDETCIEPKDSIGQNLPEENIPESSCETTPEETEPDTAQAEETGVQESEEKKCASYYKTLDTDPSVSYGITDSSVISVYDHETKSYMRMTLREYTVGVTAAEMPVSFGTEALRAQAIAARTYAIYKISRGSGCEEHPNAAVCNAPAHCCAYSGTAPEEVYAAVDDTANTVVAYDGKCICAAWHSSSDGYTRAAENVWGGRVAYLCSVPTGESRGAYGHGVGMSQYGAADMAEKGAAACDILTHYYTGGILMRIG